MSRLRRALAAAAIAAAAATAGCGLGEGESSEGVATLTVTHDYGSVPVLEAEVTEPSESETVIRVLDREADITTRYGGGFVHSINGVAGEIETGRSLDWFFFVNGVESDRGSADVAVRGGDRIWWDYRDWTNVLRTPAVVGSWPEPFAQESTAAAERLPVRVECAGDRAPCELAADRLADAGVDASIEPLGNSEPGEALRLLVGPWQELGEEAPADALAEDPPTSGVFARFEESGGTALLALDETGAESERFSEGAGLIAGLRRGVDPPTWVVTGTDAAGVEAAAGLLDEASLADRYAVASHDGTALALPVSGGPG